MTGSTLRPNGRGSFKTRQTTSPGVLFFVSIKAVGKEGSVEWEIFGRRLVYPDLRKIGMVSG